MAVRAILGQQITVTGARTLATRLVENHGRRLSSVEAGENARASTPARRNAEPPDDGPRLTHVFPEPESLVDADLAALGLPRSRAASLSALADGACGPPAGRSVVVAMATPPVVSSTVNA